jgi:hypothetical protein
MRSTISEATFTEAARIITNNLNKYGLTPQRMKEYEKKVRELQLKTETFWRY